MKPSKILGGIALWALLLLAAPPAPAWAQGEEADQPVASESESRAKNPTEVDPDLAIWTAVVFLVLLLVLWMFAWGPITEALAAREQGITSNIDQAAAKHEEARRMLAEHEAKLAKAAEEVRLMLEEARRDAEHTKTQIVAEAKSAAEAERVRAVREVDQARDAAVRSLAEDSARLAIELASKVVRKELTQDRQVEIVNEALHRMSASKTSLN